MTPRPVMASSLSSNVRAFGYDAEAQNPAGLSHHPRHSDLEGMRRDRSLGLLRGSS